MTRRVRGAERTGRSRRPHPQVLIVCSGVCTEKYYFEAFPVHGVSVRVFAKGVDPVGLVEHAARLRRERAREGGQRAVDIETWCVFDFDPGPRGNPPSAIDAALALARREGLQVAWSNECFEIWFLLHFERLTAPVPRADHAARLSRLLAQPYDKRRDDLYELLEDRMQEAITHAELLMADAGERAAHQINPGTTVHALVARLRRALRA